MDTSFDETKKNEKLQLSKIGRIKLQLSKQPRFIQINSLWGILLGVGPKICKHRLLNSDQRMQGDEKFSSGKNAPHLTKIKNSFPRKVNSGNQSGNSSRGKVSKIHPKHWGVSPETQSWNLKISLFQSASKSQAREHEVISHVVPLVSLHLAPTRGALRRCLRNDQQT